MNPANRKWVYVAVAVASASLAWRVPKAYDWWRLRRMAKAAVEVERLHDDYRKCMIGDPKPGEPQTGDEIDQLENIEMAFDETRTPESIGWPKRCLVYAERLHAKLTDSGLIAKGLDLALLDLTAMRATTLPPPLPPGAPFDAKRFMLMYTSGPTSDGIPPAPPAAPAPHLEVEDALADTSSVPDGNPVPASKLRLVWLRGGLPSRCELTAIGTAPFFSPQCGSLVNQAWLGNAEGQMIPMEDGAPDSYVTTSDAEKVGVVAGKSSDWLWEGPTIASFVFADGVLAAVVKGGKDGKDDSKRELVRARDAKAIDRTPVAPNATLLGRMLLWTEAAKGAPPHLFVREVPAQGPLPPPQDLGVVAPETSEWRACQSSEHLFVFGAREVGRAKVGNDDVVTSKVTMTIADAKLAFSTPIEGDVQWVARSTHWWQVAAPSCSGGSLALTSIVDGAVRQTVCSSTGCTQHASKKFVTERDDSRVAAIGLEGKVLFARVLDTRGPFHALVSTVRMRLAPVEALDAADEIAVYGGAGAWGWDEHFRPLAVELFSRQTAALVLVRNSDSTMGIGVDPGGAFGLVRYKAE